MSPNDKSASRPDRAGAGKSSAGGGKSSAGGGKAASGASSRRMSREAALALVLLPVLLVAGFLLGGQLLSDDTDALDTAAPVATPTTDAATEPADDETGEPATPVGPVAPEETEEPAEATAAATTPAATTPPATTPAATTPPATTAPAPAPEPADEPTQEPAQEPAQAPTQEPAAEQPAASQPPPPATGTAPPFSNPAITVFGPGQVSEDIRTWQARMAERGWDIKVDGIYGSQTKRIAAAFQAEKGLVVDGLVGPATWDAAWTAPIT